MDKAIPDTHIATHDLTHEDADRQIDPLQGGKPAREESAAVCEPRISKPTDITVPDDIFSRRPHDEGYKAVRYKIQRTYKLSDKKCAVPERIAQALNQELENIREQDFWGDRRDEAMEDSGLDPHNSAQVAAINQTAGNIMRRYVEAFSLRSAMFAAPTANKHVSQSFYQRENIRRQLGQVLVNHVSNWAEAGLQQCGLNPHSAHALHARIIGKSYHFCEDLSYNKQDILVHPTMGSAAGCSPAKLDEHITELRDYGRTKSGKLQKSYEKCRSR